MLRGEHARQFRYAAPSLTQHTYTYQLTYVPAGQWPLLMPGPLRDAFMGLGSATKQSTIASIDWTITLMLFSTILSVRN